MKDLCLFCLNFVATFLKGLRLLRFVIFFCGMMTDLILFLNLSCCRFFLVSRFIFWWFSLEDKSVVRQSEGMMCP